MTWTEKHRPKKFEEFKGQEEALKKTKQYIEKFTISPLIKKQPKPILLHGPPGTGKTTLAHIIAKETNTEIFELNTSDLRNKTNLQEILKPAIQQQSLTKKGKILLIDEVDGISTTDRGGLPELLKLIEISKHPIIITANNIWKKNLSTLRRKTEPIQLKEADQYTTKAILFTILKKENLFINNNIITSIAQRTKGDIRAAINDLQTITRLQDPSEIDLHQRNKETDIFKALKTILQEKPTNQIQRIFESTNLTTDETLLWLEKNIPAEYKKEELEKAYKHLSKADIFKRRIYKQQYWRFLLYQTIFSTYGISSAKNQPKTNYTTYKKPTRILKIWMNNQKTAKTKTIAQKYAKQTHISQKRAQKEFQTIKQIIKTNPEIQKELKLNQEEIQHLNQP